MRVDISSDGALDVLSQTMIDEDVDAGPIPPSACERSGLASLMAALVLLQTEHWGIGEPDALPYHPWRSGVRDIVFSSSPTIYGMPDMDVIE